MPWGSTKLVLGFVFSQHLPSLPLVEHASCPVGGILGGIALPPVLLHGISFRPKIANKQINKLDRRRRWQKVGGVKIGARRG